MRFVLADKNLVVGGRCYEGFPLLINDDGDAMQPAQTWLWDLLATTGRISSKKSWENYGRAVYDFFAFALSNGYDWRAPPEFGLPCAIVAWRDWSRGTLKLQASTINHRLRIVVRFYEWTIKEKLIGQLPFDYVTIQTHRPPSFLEHVNATGGIMRTPQVLLQEKQQNIRFLTKEQIVVCHEALSNVTHRLMFEIMVRTGLRQIECRTFPDAAGYVFDPSRRKDLPPGQKISLRLDPKDMEIKNSKPRNIDMPFDLMEKLWVYSVRRRQGRANANRKGEEHSPLFLTEAGVPYPKDAITAIMRALAKRVGFPVTAHMLRHTYATYLLWSLRKSKTFEGEPLLYVRDRLGHSDVSTTMIYLHLINALEGQLVSAHEDEVDRLFMPEGEAVA
ncbi:site-specific integrase [Comamonas sp. Y6]|uniref:Site-specific integrase n=1 Tax=Comamonas resistens TaxID=3046670 RepID=A0ABY8SWZ0_9BURK|nr:site-specific integrase [Comamonas resistens]MDL5039293.1 site-specific integrase [Comamonas resistens]WHS67443.1 site-specific integrase [Comamonas resistens]